MECVSRLLQCYQRQSSPFPCSEELSNPDESFFQGCIVRESQPNSFGSGFNNNGGGALATLFNENGVKQWFFPVSTEPCYNTLRHLNLAASLACISSLRFQ